MVDIFKTRKIKYNFVFGANTTERNIIVIPISISIRPLLMQ